MKIKMNKKLLMFGIPILAIGLVMAAWLIFFSGNTGFNIASQEPILFSSTLAMSNIDVTNSGTNKTESIEINNVDSERFLLFEIESVYTDTEDLCFVEPGDYQVTANYFPLSNGTSQVLTDGDFITLPTGLSRIDVMTNVKRDSCPGSLITYLNVSE